MIYGLNCGFGDPLPAEDFFLIRSLDYHAIRQDVPDAQRAPALVDNILDGGLMGIFIIPVADETACQEIAHAVTARAVELDASHKVFVEVGNEEDLGGKRWSKDPAGWTALVSDVVTIAAQHNFTGTILSGGVSSVSKDAMRWLTRSRVSDLDVEIGFHQYRSTPPTKPLDGYGSRDDEFRALLDAAKGREVWCTESGWHTAERTSGCWPFRKTWSYTDDEVTRFLGTEIALNESHGVKSFVVYQLWDGPDLSNDQDCFGIRRVDGSLKPQARVLLA